MPEGDELEDDAFHGTDLHRLGRVIRHARQASITPAAELIGPVRPGGEAARLTEDHCAFDHCAVLLSPRSLAAGLEYLERRGLAPSPPVPSTVVRRRLIERYGLGPEDCDVHITRLHLELPNGHRRPAVEVFLFPRTCPELDDHIERSEIAHGFEDHTAFTVARPDPPLLDRLVTAWRREGGLHWEGGGHNPREGGPQGTTVMYFVRSPASSSDRRRFELHCAGDLTAFISGIAVDTESVGRAYTAWRRAVRDPHPS